MNQEMTAAVLRLQHSLMNGHLQPWRAEQAEEALNCLLSKPDRTGIPFHLERNAMSDARKKLQRRAMLSADHTAQSEGIAEASWSGVEMMGESYDIFRADVVNTVLRTSSDADREILAIAIEGGTAAEVAERLGIAYELAKVRLSRARQRARSAWGNA